MKINLQLNTGHKFVGKSFGKEVTEDEFGEIVFQTGMVGYPESLTDPSYLNQILVLTYPLIGNYGIGEPELDEHGIDKIFESNKIHIKALVVGEYNPKYSHWRGKKSLGEWLKENDIIGISGLDTRELVKITRENRDVIGKITSSELSSNMPMDSVSIEEITKDTRADNVSGEEKYIINENPNLLNILVIDCGIKNSQLRALLKNDVQLTLVNTSYRFVNEVLAEKYNGIFISNGPGNPEDSVGIVEQLKEIFSINSNIPVFGFRRFFK